jgi:hypothetical protein
LTAACNNHCFFCIVDDEIAASSFRPTEQLISLVDEARPDETIDIFGGEPTIDPSFWVVARHILSSGRPMTLASNVRAFAKQALVDRLIAIGGQATVVRTTLMGAEAELHDRLNLAPNAFDQTIAGIRNLAARGIDVRVNMVVLAGNLAAITATGLLAFDSGATSFKISGPVRTGKFRGALASPGKLREAVGASAAVFALLGLPFKFEKLPFCLTGESDEHVWRVQAEAVGVDNPFFRPMASCDGCALKAACPGGELGMIAQHGEDWARPIGDPPLDWTCDLDWSELDRAELPDRVRFVRINDEGLPLDQLARLGGSIRGFSRRHAGISII